MWLNIWLLGMIPAALVVYLRRRPDYLAAVEREEINDQFAITLWENGDLAALSRFIGEDTDEPLSVIGYGLLAIFFWPIGIPLMLLNDYMSTSS